MIKILKEGKIPNQIYQQTCKYCNTEFEYDIYACYGFSYDNTYSRTYTGRFSCPFCHQELKSRPFSDIEYKCWESKRKYSY